MQPLTPIKYDLVLAGGGHAHVEVLRSLAMNPVPGLRVTLVSRSRTAIYSGMVPGFVAGQYSLDDISVNLDRLCRLGGHRLIIGEITALDPVAQKFELEGRPPLAFDFASINVGSAPDLAIIQGAAEFATPVKPIEGFARRFAALESTSSAGSLAIVGGGAGGVELALALSARFPDRQLSLFDAHPSLLHRLPKAAQTWAQKRLEDRDVALHLGERVAEITKDGPLTSQQHKADLSLLVTGSKAPNWLSSSGLKTDAKGFMQVDASLSSLSHPIIFGAGDCADYTAFPREKAGVFAVRAGPILATNLAKAARHEPLQALKMQQRGLQIIGDGKGEALAIRGGLATGRFGKTLFGWKDRIDRVWMDRYNRFGEDMVAAMEAKPEAMRCSGCGGKVSGGVLEDNLGALALSGDVGVISEDQVASVDLIRDAFDDPFIFAQVAAAHALSDVFAARATNPKMLSALTLPYASSSLVGRDLSQLKAGLEKAGAEIVGGHTAEGAELSAALTVIGTKSKRLQIPVESGQALLLTKPLGVGLILAARMLGKARPSDVDAVIEHCLASNQKASEVLADFDLSLSTDVTGFGLLGHLQTMLGSSWGADLDIRAIQPLSGALEAFEQGVRPSLLAANMESTSARLRRGSDLSPAFEALLHDPQTSGGLMAAIPAKDSAQALKSLKAAGLEHASIIGHIRSGSLIKVG